MRISDWSSDVCSSDLRVERRRQRLEAVERGTHVDGYEGHPVRNAVLALVGLHHAGEGLQHRVHRRAVARRAALAETRNRQVDQSGIEPGKFFPAEAQSLCDTRRSEEHTSELQSLMRISYAVFCLKKKKKS